MLELADLRSLCLGRLLRRHDAGAGRVGQKVGHPVYVALISLLAKWLLRVVRLAKVMVLLSLLVLSLRCPWSHEHHLILLLSPHLVALHIGLSKLGSGSEFLLIELSLTWLLHHIVHLHLVNGKFSLILVLHGGSRRMIGLNLEYGLLMVRLNLWEQSHIGLIQSDPTALNRSMCIKVLHKISRTRHLHLLIEACKVHL